MNIAELSDKTRIECEWLTSFTWEQLNTIQPITDSIEDWTRALIKHNFDVIMACPLATGYKYTYGELSSSGRSDWMKYAKALERIYKE